VDGVAFWILARDGPSQGFQDLVKSHFTDSPFQAISSWLGK